MDIGDNLNNPPDRINCAVKHCRRPVRFEGRDDYCVVHVVTITEVEQIEATLALLSNLQLWKAGTRHRE
jgi:hypothetical protein